MLEAALDRLFGRSPLKLGMRVANTEVVDVNLDGLVEYSLWSYLVTLNRYFKYSTSAIDRALLLKVLPLS